MIKFIKIGIKRQFKEIIIEESLVAITGKGMNVKKIIGAKEYNLTNLFCFSDRSLKKIKEVSKINMDKIKKIGIDPPER